MLSRFTHDIIAAPLKSSLLVSSSSIAAAAIATTRRSTSSSSAIKRLSNAAGVSTLAVRASTSTSCAARTDDYHHGASRKKKPTSNKKKSKSAVVRNGEYKRPATFIKPAVARKGEYNRPATWIKPVAIRISKHRLITAFAQAQTSFESTIDYVLWDLKTVAPGTTLREPARWNTHNEEAEELCRKHPLSSSSLEERTAAAIAKLLRFGYVSQARKVLEMSNLLRTKFTPASLASIARAVAKMPSVILPEPPAPDPMEALSSELPLHLTAKIFELSTKWFLWELRPQLYDAAKRKRQDAVYESHLRCAVEEFMWRLFDLRDWSGVLETFDGTAMNLKKAHSGGGAPPSVKMCQLAMQAVFARHYYDAPGKENKQKVNDEGRGQRETSGANTVKDGYGWTKPSDHRVLFKKIAGIVEVMRKSGVDPLYPEVHAIVLRELGWLVSSGKTMMSVKLVEDWLVYYEAAMAVRVPPKTPTTPPSTPSQPPPSIILAAAEAILNILEEAKNQLDFKWTKAGQVSIARQKDEYLESTLKCAFDEVMGYLEGRHSAPLIGETVDQHAKVQSVLIRRYLLQDDVRAAWSVWTKLVDDVEEAREPKERPGSKGRGGGDQRHRRRPEIPPTISLRLDSAYARILQTARRLDDVEFICTTALSSSSRILDGQNASFIWRKTLEALVRRPPVEEERLRLLGALRTLDSALEEHVATTPSTATQPSRGGGRKRRDIVHGIFTGHLVEVARLWWSLADQTAESTKRVGEMFEKFGVVLKAPSKRTRSRLRTMGDV